MSTGRIAVVGDGKMGRAVAQLASEREITVVTVVGAHENADGAALTRERLGDAEVVIEFTEPSAAVANVLAATRAGYPVVVGTTGWYDALPTVVTEVTRLRGAIVYAPNFSVGVNLFLALAAASAEMMRSASDFEAHIVETHHAAKKDAPSGTAIALRRAMALGGASGPGVTSVRVGHVPGTHELIFDGPFEQIRLTHAARDRRVFADGALRAAMWLRGRTGVFTMRHVLELEKETGP